MSKPIFDNNEQIEIIRKEEKRNKILSSFSSVFEDCDGMTPYDTGVIVREAIDPIFADNDVNDIFDFIRGVKEGGR